MDDSKPTLDRVQLKRGCFDIAAQILGDSEPVDVPAIQRLADAYYEIAADSVVEEFILECDRDPNLVLLIARYLGQRHGIPPCGESVRWFQEMFHCLVELACSNCAGTEEDERFFREIEQGIATSRAQYQEEV